jgi:phosphoglycerate dehydrogenase-like enzyme
MIGTDLIRDIRMYNLPKDHIQDLESKYGVLWYVDPEDYLQNETLCKSITMYLGDRITTEMVKNLPNLNWIHLTCVGTDKLNGIDELDRDIVVTNSKGIMTEPMVASIISMMFGLARIQPQCSRLKNSNLLTREAVNDYFFKNIQDVFGQTCLIVGYGEVGRKLEEVLKPFNMNIITINNSTSLFKLRDMKLVIMDADYVINLLPDTNQTKNVFNKYIFERMKPSAYFINVGRGSTVVEDDLIEALQAKEIDGAALDVFQQEPLSQESELLQLHNVILSPHIASYSQNYWKKEMELYYDNLNRYSKNLKLMNIVYDNRK